MQDIIKTKIFVLKDNSGNLINDIDTDMIFHNQYLSIVDISKMGQYTFDNLDGYKNFSKIAEKDMLVVTGENFGSGSSRQQAVDCFISLGIKGIAAQSFGAIYKRNGINSGFPLIEITSIKPSALETGNTLSFDLNTGEISDSQSNNVGSFKKFSSVQKEIIEKGGLFKVV